MTENPWNGGLFWSITESVPAVLIFLWYVHLLIFLMFIEKCLCVHKHLQYFHLTGIKISINPLGRKGLDFGLWISTWLNTYLETVTCMLYLYVFCVTGHIAPSDHYCILSNSSVVLTPTRWKWPLWPFCTVNEKKACYWITTGYFKGRKKIILT